MKIPLIMHLAVYLAFLPVLVAMTRAREIVGARLTIVAWCLLLLFMDMIGFYIGRVRGLNNHFLSYIFTPIQGATVLWALSLWQIRPVARLTMRLAIPLFIAAWVFLTLRMEDIRNFSAAVEPVYSLLALGAALFTILSRSSDESESLLRQDWFWICGGFVLYFGALAVLTPLGAAFIHSDPMLIYRAYVVRSWVAVVAFIFIAIGMLCPQPIRSGHFS